MSNDGLPEPEDAFDAKLVGDVREYGWHCVLVGAEGEADPPFAYTVGLTHTYGHPELVLVGPWQFAHGILGAAVELVDDGARLRRATSPTTCSTATRCASGRWRRTIAWPC